MQRHKGVVVPVAHVTDYLHDEYTSIGAFSLSRRMRSAGKTWRNKDLLLRTSLHSGIQLLLPHQQSPRRVISLISSAPVSSLARGGASLHLAAEVSASRMLVFCRLRPPRPPSLKLEQRRHVLASPSPDSDASVAATPIYIYKKAPRYD